MLHLAKGEKVGFTHEEEVETETEQKAPRNWIPERNWKNYNKYSENSQLHTEVNEVTSNRTKAGEISPNKVRTPEEMETRSARSEISQQKNHIKRIRQTYLTVKKTFRLTF